MEASEKAAKQYLTFKLAHETFAVDVDRVREILDFISITKVPQTPDFMRGVINLRGSVVPVVDMKLKFGMEETEKTVDTCIIVLEVAPLQIPWKRCWNWSPPRLNLRRASA